MIKEQSMKQMKRIFVSLLLVVIAISLSACKDSGYSAIKGKWYVSEENILLMTGLTKEEYDNFKQMGLEQTVTWEFYEDGMLVITMNVAGQYVKDDMPYELKDGKIYIQGDAADYKIRRKTLTITQEDVKLVLTKAK